MSFLAYYLHWDRAALMNMTHNERRRWCEEISKINKKLGGEKQGNTYEFK